MQGKGCRIANTPDASHKGGVASNLEDRTKQEMTDEAKKIGSRGYSSMNKSPLVDAIRNSK